VRRVCGAQDSLLLRRSLTAQTRGGWIPVTGTGMTEGGEAARVQTATFEGSPPALGNTVASHRPTKSPPCQPASHAAPSPR
jgi:hypothetical protein